MAYKVLVIDDKQVNKEMLDVLMNSAHPAALFDGIPKNIPIAEIAGKIKRVF